jgi:hypothetical protein
MTTQTQRIRTLNDDLRKYLIGGGAVMTPGIAALRQEAIDRIVKTIAVHDDFCHANDPHEEHDFGSFEAEGEKIFFKVDYYDGIAPAIRMESRATQASLVSTSAIITS